MRDRRRHTWTAWIAVWAFLLSGIWPGIAFGQDGIPPIGYDVCSASRTTSDRSAPVNPTHTHKHCADCVLGAALQFGAPHAEQAGALDSPSRFTPRSSVQRIASISLIVGTSPRGPPASV